MPEHFSLAGRAWAPVALTDGQRRYVHLSDITDPSVRRIDTGRPDCDTALAEFLIGFLAVAFGPAKIEDWHRLYHEPPSKPALDKAFAPFADALVLDGAGPRFFQDIDDLDGKPSPVEALFIDAPADHFLAEQRFETLSRAGAALALLTLQTMAPSGGAGHRTSLRGGGPLTTFVVPDDPGRPASLWQFLWANLPLGFAATSCGADIFPWLAKTRTSNPKQSGIETAQDSEGVAKAQAFFGMPRRIRLTFVPNTDKVPCDLTGVIDDVIVREYVTRPWGVNYPSHAWRHPLSPYYRQRATSPEWLPVHLKQSRVGYRDWLGLVASKSGALQEAAAVVSDFRNRRAGSLGLAPESVRLRACGYALDNMKPLDFGESTIPLLHAGDAERNEKLDGIAEAFVESAEEASYALRSALKRALFGDAAKVDNSSTVLSAIDARFWAETEHGFYVVLAKLTKAIAAAPGDIDDHMRDIRPLHASAWRDAMAKVALANFDDTAPIDDVAAERMADVVAARKSLSLFLKGFGNGGRAFFNGLGLEPPDAKSGGSGSKPPRGGS